MGLIGHILESSFDDLSDCETVAQESGHDPKKTDDHTNMITSNIYKKYTHQMFDALFVTKESQTLKENKTEGKRSGEG